MITIVGAGICGATLARECATTYGRKVLVIERRNHIGGNCYDFVDENGVLVPMYGAHFFHTNDREVWRYVSRFTDWTPYEHRALSSVDGLLVPVPVNISTVNMLLGQQLQTEREMRTWLDQNVEKIEEPKNSEEVVLVRVGRALYERMFKGYTMKQWDRHPSELAPEVTNRLPVHVNFDDRYFTDEFQGMPREGYVALFERMLKHDNIEVRLSTDYFRTRDHLPEPEMTFFTGRVDDFFAGSVGRRLEYRSLRFEYKWLCQKQYQPRAVVNYSSKSVEFTRVIEPKHATGQIVDGTTIIREYPTWRGDPFYPVLDRQNMATYEIYRELAEREERDQRVWFVGRLASYKYFNMDQAFAAALETVRRAFA